MGYTILSQFLCRCIIVKKSNVEMNLELYIWVREEGGYKIYYPCIYNGEVSGGIFDLRKQGECGIIDNENMEYEAVLKKEKCRNGCFTVIAVDKCSNIFQCK